MADKPQDQPDPGQVTDQPADQQGSGDKVEKEQYIAFNVPGRSDSLHLTPKEVIEAARYGLIKMEEERATKSSPPASEEEEEVDNSLEARFTRLQEEVSTYKKEREAEQQYAQINFDLNQAKQQHEYTRNNPKMAEKIATIVLAKINLNPRLSIAETFRKEVEDFVERDKAVLEQKVRDKTMGVQRGNNLPTVDKSKQYKAVDVKSGAARRALSEFLERAQQ